MKYNYFIGIDVSKYTIDAAIIDRQQPNGVFHNVFSNDPGGFGDMILFFTDTFPSFKISRALFCMEASGVYCSPLLNFSRKNKIRMWVENPVRIKRSMGLTRGKNDIADAKRIADYTYRNHDKANLWNPSSNTLQQIKHLATMRSRMVTSQKRLRSPFKEFNDTGQAKMAAFLERSVKKTMKAIDNDIRKIEARIMTCLRKDDDLLRLFKIITSVVGIGPVTATNLLVHTNGFTILKDSRKLACYCGVAPFTYQSGVSVRGKTRVHNMANKKLKTNLHMASVTAVKLDPDLKNYYERKVAQGKSKLSALNAVKCKLLSRIVACVNNDKLYVKSSAEMGIIIEA